MNLQGCRASVGIDSLYTVVKYPHVNLFRWWAAAGGGVDNPKLREGVEHRGLLIRRGVSGYRLSVWDGDARLLLTDQVDDELRDTPRAGQGMGVMLQIGPKWLAQYGGGRDMAQLVENVVGQLIAFGMDCPVEYEMRLNLLDVRVDVVGLALAEVLGLEWDPAAAGCQWVGYARPRAVYFGEGLHVGTREGAVQLRIYDKVKEAQSTGDAGFWWSVWGSGEGETPPVTRFEWSVKVYEAGFAGLRYLTDLTVEKLGALLAYLVRKWGRIVEVSEDSNRWRWPPHPLWQAVSGWLCEWCVQRGELRREYRFEPDLSPRYVRSFAGWLAGFQARLGLAERRGQAASLMGVFECMDDMGCGPGFVDRLARDRYRRWLPLVVRGGE